MAKKKAAEEEELYRVPELTPDEQLDVDWPKEGHMFMGAGARVLALWGSEYYAAHICGSVGKMGKFFRKFLIFIFLRNLIKYKKILTLTYIKRGVGRAACDGGGEGVGPKNWEAVV